MKNIRIKRDSGEFDIEVNKINLFVGQNGIGKTLVNKCVWFMSFVAFSYENLKKLNAIEEEYFSRIFKIYFNQTFFDSKDFDIELEAEFEDGVVFKIFHSEDKLTFFPPEDMKNISFPTPVYCSTETRLFSSLERVGKMTHTSIKDTDRVEDLDYTIYDFMFSEQMKHKLSKGIEVTKELEEVISKFINFKIKSFEYSEGSYWYVDEHDTKKRLKSLSNGEQSLLVLLLANQH